MSTERTGFIGLGQMGSGIALNMLKNTGSLMVIDRNTQAVARLVDVGATACRDVADLASKCDLIFLCLPFTPEVREVIFSDHGIVPHCRPGLTIIDTTTLDRNDAVSIGGELQEINIDYWDCPVSGLPARAQEGSLTVMFGGSDEAYAKHQLYLQSFSSFMVHAGPLGCGQAMKAINNIIYNINIAALCEILPLAVASGLDPDELARVVTSASARSFAAEHFVPKMRARIFDGDFPMQAAQKDIDNVQRMVDEFGVHLPLFNAMTEDYQSAIDAGDGGDAKSSMLKVFERALGVSFGDQ